MIKEIFHNMGFDEAKQLWWIPVGGFHKINLVDYKDTIFLIDDKVSADRLIQSADIIVSKPFSTTALIAKNINKPSIFFDPTSMIWNLDPALRDIPILSNKTQLKSYIIKTLSIID